MELGQGSRWRRSAPTARRSSRPGRAGTSAPAVDDRPAVPVRDLTEHTQRVSSVAFNPKDGRTFVTGSFDRTCRLWDAATGGRSGTVPASGAGPRGGVQPGRPDGPRRRPATAPRSSGTSTGDPAPRLAASPGRRQRGGLQSRRPVRVHGELGPRLALGRSDRRTARAPLPHPKEVVVATFSPAGRAS